MTSAYLGIDVGTSGCKAVVLARSGTLLATASTGVASSFGNDGSATQRPTDWLDAVRSTVRTCIEMLHGTRIDGIGLTAPAHVAVLTSASGRPLAPALLAFDARPAPAATLLRLRYGSGLFDATFVELSAGWTLAQLEWLRESRPDLWPRIRWILPQKDWIRFVLTGVPLVDPSDAAGMALLDQQSMTWIAPILIDLGLSGHHLPPVVPSMSSGGVLQRRWARELGLPAGTPVVVGATDTAAELVSVGAVQAGSSLVKLATTGTVVSVTKAPQPDPILMTYRHAVSGRWYTVGATNAAAAAYGWLQDVLAPGAGEGPSYPEMDRLAAKAPAGADGALFLPFLRGERTPHWDPDLRAAFLGLTSGHGRQHLARAVLEGVAYSVRDCRDSMAARGFRVTNPYLTGGGQRSQLWRQILVTVLGTRGTFREIHGPAVGAAILAMAEPRMNPREVAALVPPSPVTRVLPVRRWLAGYDRGYEIYREAVLRTTGISHALNESRT